MPDWRGLVQIQIVAWYHPVIAKIPFIFASPIIFPLHAWNFSMKKATVKQEKQIINK